MVRYGDIRQDSARSPNRLPDSYSLRQDSVDSARFSTSWVDFSEIRHDLATYGDFAKFDQDWLYLGMFDGVARCQNGHDCRAMGKQGAIRQGATQDSVRVCVILHDMATVGNI